MENYASKLCCSPALLADCGLSVGDLIEVRDFAVRKARRLNRNDKVVYLGIQDLEILSRHESADWGDEGGVHQIRGKERTIYTTTEAKTDCVARAVQRASKQHTATCFDGQNSSKTLAGRR